MKKIMLLAVLIAVLLSITALSQLNPVNNIATKTSQVTPTINVSQQETCTTNFYDELQNVYGNCILNYNYTRCMNSSGPNTDCSIQQGEFTYTCKTGIANVTKNKTECKPNNEFIISIDQGAAVLKKQIDYSEWGPCIYSAENSCLIVTCVSNDDGAFKGQFTDCKGGKSCQRFEICDNSIKTLYKNSRESFVEDDPSFYLNKLPIVEVTK